MIPLHLRQGCGLTRLFSPAILSYAHLTVSVFPGERPLLPLALRLEADKSARERERGEKKREGGLGDLWSVATLLGTISGVRPRCDSFLLTVSFPPPPSTPATAA